MRRDVTACRNAARRACIDVLANLIGALYAVEAQIRQKKLRGEAKREYRLDHARPIVDAFFSWVQRKFEEQGLLPSNPLTLTLAYARNRRVSLEAFLADPDVPVDTNHLERALRPIPLGRKNWMFCWTVLGAQQLRIVQSLITTCRLHDVDPYDYLVDVLQRVDQHPASDVRRRATHAAPVEAAFRRKPPALQYLIAYHPAITPGVERLPAPRRRAKEQSHHAPS